MIELHGSYTLTRHGEPTPAAAHERLAAAMRDLGYTVTPSGSNSLRFEGAQAGGPRRLPQALPPGAFDVVSAEGALCVKFRLSLDAQVWVVGIFLTVAVLALLALGEWEGAGRVIVGGAALYFVNRAIWYQLVVAILTRTFPPEPGRTAGPAPAA